MHQRMIRIPALAGIGLALGTSIAQAQQCPPAAAPVHATVTPVQYCPQEQYCPEDVCETGKFPRLRTMLRRMSWKHSTSHSHFMYESCPPYWQPAFGYRETSWRHGEALPPQCPAGCPPIGAPVWNPAPVATPAYSAERPADPLPQSSGPVIPQPAATAEPAVVPGPPQQSVPESAPGSVAPQGKPKTPETPVPPPMPEKAEGIPTPAMRTPQATGGNQSADARPTRLSAFEKALAGSVTHEVFPEAATQMDAFPLRPLPVPSVAAVPVTEAGRDGHKTALTVSRVSFTAPAFTPIDLPLGCGLGMAVTTGEFVMRSVARSRH